MGTATPFCPKVSIVIPVYNGANYLRESIDSALAQTYPHCEVIVVNDGSCDEGATEEIALSYGDKIRYFTKENGGVSSALNVGIHHMTGDYFSWLSHDDKYEPEKIAHSVTYLATFEQRDRLLAMCGGYYIDKDSHKTKEMYFDFAPNRVYNGLEVVEHILQHGVLDACCLLIPKTAFDECGHFNEQLPFNQDALMWYQIFCHNYGLVVKDKDKDVAYRLHATQTSKTRRDLLLQSARELSRLISPVFAEKSCSAHPLLYRYAKRMARLNCTAALKEGLRIGKDTAVLSFWDRVRLRGWQLYGKGRFLIKTMYLRLFYKK